MSLKRDRARFLAIPEGGHIQWPTTRRAWHMERFGIHRNPSEILKNRAGEVGYDWMDVLALAGATPEEIDLVEEDCEFLLPVTVLINALIILGLDCYDYMKACGYLPDGWDLEKHHSWVSSATKEWNDYVAGVRHGVSREIARRVENREMRPKSPPWAESRQLAKEVYGD